MFTAGVFALWATAGVSLTGAWADQADAPPAKDWPQVKYDSRRSGDAADQTVGRPLGLVGAVPLTDAVFTAPVVSGGRVCVVDAAGVVFCVDAATLRVLWRFETRGGPPNCNNVSSPAVAGAFLHLGTTAGSYYVLDAASGKVVREIDCGEPILASPVVANGRVYFITLGSQVHALEPDGTLCWKWDYVKEQFTERYEVEPGYRIFESYIIGLPPIFIGVRGNAVFFPYTKPCHGTFLLRIESPEEVEHLRKLKPKKKKK